MCAYEEVDNVPGSTGVCLMVMMMGDIYLWKFLAMCVLLGDAFATFL